MKNNYLNWVLLIPLLFMGISIPTQLFSQWDKETVTTGGRFADIAVDSAGVVHVAYLIDPYGSDVAYGIRQADLWTTTTLTNSGKVHGIALAVDTSDAPHIIYAEANPSDFNFYLKYITYTQTGWSSPETIVTSDTDMDFWSPTIAIDRDNHIHITYLYTDADAGSGVIHYWTNAS